MNSDQLLQLDIVTPDRQVIANLQAKEITLPGTAGAMTILPGHRNIVSTLSTGVVRWINENGDEEQCAISWGYMENLEDKITLLAETLELTGEIDIERAHIAKELSEKKLMTESLDEKNYNKYRLKLQRAMTRIGIKGTTAH